jgi:hypothetical protein
MKSVFIVVHEEVLTIGQGMYEDANVLSTYGSWGDEKEYPAFKSKEDAERFKKEVDGSMGDHIIEIKLWEFKE